MPIKPDYINPSSSEFLYSTEEIRRLDKLAVEVDKVPSLVLMKRAGKSAFNFILQKYPKVSSLVLFCGAGNNAGDGFIIAGLAASRGIDVKVVSLRAPSLLIGDASSAYEHARNEGLSQLHIFDSGQFCFPDDINLSEGAVIVDCLLGTGIKDEVRENYKQAIRWINSQELPVVAVDVPSGICCDSGKVLGEAVVARDTLTFIGLKKGLLTGDAIDHVGNLALDDLGVSLKVFNQVDPKVQKLSLVDLKNRLPKRLNNSHKGQSGRSLIIGGNHGMGGAVCMTAEAAVRSGAGLVTVVTRQENISAMLGRTPELMAKTVDSVSELANLIENVKSIALGPGLGQDSWAKMLFISGLNSEAPMVLDADGLNLLALLTKTREINPNDYKADWILTPHPGEAARLLNISTKQVQADRFAAAQALQASYGGTVILKGAGTIIASKKQNKPRLFLTNLGNPGMAVGGMGDVLTGIIAGLLAQGVGVLDAARLGVLLHAEAGDMCAREYGQIGMLATDLIPKVRQLINS